MARYTGSVCRLCRREGCKLFLKGDKCYSDKCAVGNRQTPPGEHGQARQRKMSEYGMQLREKQKAKRTYGVLEGQFHHYFEEADRQKGITGENLLVLLERRLDNVVYRLGSVGDVITIREKSAESDHFKALREGTGKVMPQWLTIDASELKATVVAMPKREDVGMDIKENLIVELYSR